MTETTNSTSTSPIWSPDYPTTTRAWQAVRTNLLERQHLGLWGSRSVAVSIARSRGLTAKRAEDLIVSAVRHGYLEQREGPLDCNALQVRLPPGAGRG